MSFIILLFLIILLIINSCDTKLLWGGQKDEFIDDYMNQKTTCRERGIAAVLIIMHHISKKIEVGSIFILIRYIAFILVAVFFFVSGYGLVYGLTHKHCYLKGFFRKRVLKIMLPYWIVLIVNIVFDSILYKREYNFMDLIFSFLGFENISGIWFVGCILIMYISFFIIFSIVESKGGNINAGICIMGIIILLYCLVCTYIKLPSCYTASISAFLLGLGWRNIGPLIIQTIRRSYLKFLLYSSLLFLLFFGGRLFIASCGFEYEPIQLVMRNIISILFIFLIIIVTQKVNLKGNIVLFLGEISYELYLTHWVIMKYIDPDITFYPVVIFFLTLIAAMCIDQVCRKIEYNTK